MRSKIIEEYKKSLRLSSDQRALIVGTLLGDGCLETQNHGRSYRLKIEHAIDQKEYVDWKYSVLKDWVLTEPRIKAHMSYGKLRENYCFSTVSHGELRFYGQQFYKNNEKIIPKMIAKMLSPLALAVWFMDDGSIKSKLHRALVIHSQSFERTDLEIIIEILLKNYKIKAVLRKRSEGKGFVLSLAAESVDIFVKTIFPYIIPSMRYKLGNTIA